MHKSFPEENVLALVFFELPFSNSASFTQSDKLKIERIQLTGKKKMNVEDIWD